MAKTSTSGQGRPKGALNKATQEIKELLRGSAKEIAKELVRLCKGAENETTRVAAIKEYNDRMYGKPHQTAELSITDRRADELTDDDLAGIITTGRGPRVIAPPRDPSQLN